MDDVCLAEQIKQLRDEQFGLEKELFGHASEEWSQNRSKGAIIDGEGEDPPSAADGRSMQGLVDSHKFHKLTMARDQSHAEPVDKSHQDLHAALPLHEHLMDLERLKRQYQKNTSIAMSRYFNAVSDFPAYKSRREKRLHGAKSFSFEKRELMKEQGIRAQRRLQEAQQREMKEKEMLRARFKATPVPPTTFMNKYDLMVEEWCQRKAAIEMLAKEKARRMKEESAFIKQSAQELRQTREELMGVCYDAEGHPITIRQRKRRAQSLDERRVSIFRSKPVPIEARIQLWPAVEAHEQTRMERIKHRAMDLKKQADQHMIKATPSHPPAKQVEMQLDHLLCGRFGIGQPTQPVASLPVPVAPQSVELAATVPTATASSATIQAPVASVASTIAVPQLYPGGYAAPAFTNLGAQWGIGAPCAVNAPSSVPYTLTSSAATTAVVSAERPLTAPSVSEQPKPYDPTHSQPTCALQVTRPGKEKDTLKNAPKPYNPHLTFKPRVKPGVPNFKLMWCEEKVALDERRKKIRPTVPKPFDLTPSSKDGVVTGKRSSRARSLSPRPHPSRVRSAKRVDVAPAGVGAQDTEAPASDKNKPSATPAGTRAHALRTEAVYSKYLKEASKKEHTTDHDEEYMKEALRRRRAVSRRLKEYLADPKVEHEAVIRAKVRALRVAMKENERAAQERLDEMKRRVLQMPPVFAEPAPLHDIAKARAETELEILKMLRDTGLDGSTIKDILAKAAQGVSPDDEAATVEAATATKDTGITSETQNPDVAASHPILPTKPSISDSGSGRDSSGDSDSSSSATSSKHVNKKNDYDSDSFESSSSAGSSMS